MGKLVNSNRKKKFDRGPDIQPQKSFTIESKPQEEEKITYEPQPTTIKIDTKIRDQINALTLIGIADTQREVLESLIDQCLDGMTPDEKRKFEIQYQVLEDKTIKTLNKNKK